MNEFESFASNEAAEGFDPAAFELFQEKLKEQAKQGKKDQAKEKKHQASETQLFEILKHIILSLGVSHPLASSVINCLSANLNPQLIVVGLSLNFSSLQKKLGLKLHTENSKPSTEKNKQIQCFDSQLPEFVKLNIGIYLQAIREHYQAELNWNQQKFQEYSQSPQAFKNLIAIILQEHMQLNQLDFNAENIIEFTNSFVDKLLENKQAKIQS